MIVAGTINLGADKDGFRLAAGGTLIGTVAGEVGTDTATLELAGDRTISTDILSDFGILQQRQWYANTDRHAGP
ncbi:hypothetical protein ASE69_16555 [Sphingomonas sp. Leaf208]|uniref:hypothetical protein n=1 Tax=Sphingomonas sp. Leaf208 TaxID=1735679 RepID=UPI0006FDBAD8|nr:hypothetical protein [Sphingomonas sp. Leaf208]KQM46306.1 hypothetical protein ASE69_16555 [Sphingomonas sp. Leaf208]